MNDRAALARAVGGEPGLHHAPGPGRDVDDHAAARGLDHVRHREARHQERRGHVEAERLLEGPLARAQQRLRGPAAGVVDEDVDPAELATMAASTSASSWARSVTSVGTTSARRPVARTSLAVSLELVDRAGRAPRRRLPPRPARWRCPAPMPRPAPVTMATLSVTLNRSRIIGFPPGSIRGNRTTAETVGEPHQRGSSA